MLPVKVDTLSMTERLCSAHRHVNIAADGIGVARRLNVLFSGAKVRVIAMRGLPFHNSAAILANLNGRRRMQFFSNPNTHNLSKNVNSRWVLRSA
jgi:hypothetical protein